MEAPEDPKKETDLSYLSAMYYTAAALLLVCALFSALTHDYRLSILWLILGIGLFAYRLRSSKKNQ